MRIIYFFVLIFSLGYAFWLNTLSIHTTSFNYFFNIIGSLNFLLAGITSLVYLVTSKTHKSIYLTLALSSLFYFCAQLTWYLYNIYYVTEIPYPSYTDLFYILFYASLALAGVLSMIKIKFKFHFTSIFEIFIVALVIMLITHSFMNSVSTSAPDSPLELILNFAYPALDAIMISLTLAAIRSQYGRLQPMLLYFIISFIMLTFGDTIFGYQTSLGTYWNGNLVDIFFAISGYFYAMGIVNMPQLLNTQDTKLT